MYRERGFAHLLLILLVLVLIAAAAFFLYNKGLLNIPGLSPKSSPDPASLLKTEYQNPFEEKANYSNPFSESEYQNPFEALE